MYYSVSINSKAGRLAGLAAVAGLLLAAPTARAQDGGQPASVVCPLVQAAQRCVDLDARKSIDPAGEPLTYRWQMGDGTTLTGPVVSHCYAQRARYTVQLDVVVASTGEVRPAEKTLVVDFTEDQLLDFTQSADTVHVGGPVSFDASKARYPPCANEQIVWDFRDGFVAAGPRASHSFRKPGLFEVRMSLRGVGPAACSESHCASRPVLVLP